MTFHTRAGAEAAKQDLQVIALFSQASREAGERKKKNEKRERAKRKRKRKALDALFSRRESRRLTRERSIHIHIIIYNYIYTQ